MNLRFGYPGKYPDYTPPKNYIKMLFIVAFGDKGMGMACLKKYLNVVIPVRVIVYHLIKTVRHFFA